MAANDPNLRFHEPRIGAYFARRWPDGIFLRLDSLQSPEKARFGRHERKENKGKTRRLTAFRRIPGVANLSLKIPRRADSGRLGRRPGGFLHEKLAQGLDARLSRFFRAAEEVVA